MSTPPEKVHPLQPVLADVESELRRRLHEACEVEARGVRTESSDEIRRLEDSLLAAAVAAEQTIALRRHMREHPDPADPAAAQAREALDAGTEMEPVTTLREFADRTGRKWRAWQVTPGLARTHSNSERFLGQFQQGWVCFEALDKSGRRRLPCQRSRWAGAKEEDLEQMLDEAISAPERQREKEHEAEAERSP